MPSGSPIATSTGFTSPAAPRVAKSRNGFATARFQPNGSMSQPSIDQSSSRVW
jgi:hypothetical protein